MIKWFAKFNLSLFVLILSASSPVFSQESRIVPDTNVRADDCEENTDVIPTCLRNRQTPTNPAELITGDLAVCNCIDKTKGNILTGNTPSNPQSEEELRKYKERRIEQIGRVAATSNVLNSTSYSTDSQSLNNNLIGLGAGEIRGQLKKEPVSLDGRQIDAPMLDEAFSRIGTIPPENASWQCITIQEYQAHRTIPTDNKFYEMLKTATFNPADWNETTLKTQFDTATDANRENIRQKIIFLSRNPIFKAILKAQPTETITAEVIAAKQAQILQAIQKLKPADNSTCATKVNGCWRELQGNGKVNEFKADAMAITNDPQVHDIASAQNAKTYLDELRRLTEAGQIVSTPTVPTTPEGYFALMQNENGDIARRCAGSNVDASCYVSFANHCSAIRAIDNRVRIGLRTTSSELTDQLFQEEVTEARMDPDNNPAFRAFNDSICLQAFADSAGRELNFFQYRDAYCSGENKYPECSDRKKLLSRFLREHNSGDESASSVRESFGELVESNEYVDATAAQVATANNISESPAQIRARFGGQYPTITPKGEIKAPATSVASDSSGSGSTTTTDASVDSKGTTVGVVTPVSTQDNRVQSKIPASIGSADVSTDESQNYVQAVRNPTPSFLGALNRYVPTQNPVVQTDDNRQAPTITSVETQQKPEPDTNRVPEASIVTSSGSGVISNGGSSSGRTVRVASGGGGSSSVAVTGSDTTPKAQPKTPQNLNFKYNLNRDGSVIQPDVEIIPVVNQPPVRAISDQPIENLRSNPASLVLSSAQISEIMANPGSEVPVEVKSKSGESLTVYAKKDSAGNLTYSLEPGPAGRSPASSGNIVRARLSASVYENVLRDPDTALNQNENLVNELATKEDGSTITLQIVSDGKRALTFEVTKKDDLLYHYRLKR